MKNGEMERDWKVTKQTSNIPDILQTKQKYKKKRGINPIMVADKKTCAPHSKSKTTPIKRQSAYCYYPFIGCVKNINYPIIWSDKRPLMVGSVMPLKSKQQTHMTDAN